MSIAEEFENKASAIPYPERPKKPRREDFENNAAHGKALDEWEEAVTHYRDREREYREVHGAIHDEFKRAIAASLGLSNHPKFDVLWDIAWSHGHSSGYGEVEMWCDELSALLTE